MSLIFVFGSNIQGQHAGGAAAAAVTQHGAIWGIGEGLQGQAYALPTMEGWEALQVAVKRFLTLARANPQLSFYITPIGCGIAGYEPEMVAPLFLEAPDNVALCMKLVQALIKQ